MVMVSGSAPGVALSSPPQHTRTSSFLWKISASPHSAHPLRPPSSSTSALPIAAALPSLCPSRIHSLVSHQLGLPSSPLIPPYILDLTPHHPPSRPPSSLIRLFTIHSPSTHPHILSFPARTLRHSSPRRRRGAGTTHFQHKTSHKYFLSGLQLFPRMSFGASGLVGPVMVVIWWANTKSVCSGQVGVKNQRNFDHSGIKVSSRTSLRKALKRGFYFPYYFVCHQSWRHKNEEEILYRYQLCRSLAGISYLLLNFKVEDCFIRLNVVVQDTCSQYQREAGQCDRESECFIAARKTSFWTDQEPIPRHKQRGSSSRQLRGSPTRDNKTFPIT